MNRGQGQTGRSREYGAHPVPLRAKNFGHLARYFHAEGPRVFKGPGGNDATGFELAAELTRGLMPDARARVFA